VVDATDELEWGRESYVRRAWVDAYESLSRADQESPLGAEDLELLATSAYMLGRDDDMSGMERAYHVYLSAGEALRAARCAFWVGMHLSIRGEMGRGTGWLGRSQRLVEREGRECVEQGYLKLPLMFQQEAAGDYEAAAAIAAEAAEIGERFRDADLFALAVQAQGIFLIKHGRVEEGLGLLDEAMVAVTAGELSPIVSGLVYCGMILGCQDAYELRRAQEWTAALTRWCKDQPDMVAFTGTCMVPRVRVLLGLACRTLGDEDTAALELEAARGDFANLGAAPDLARVDSLTHRASPVHVHGLTPREHEVLRLIAAGKTNKAIAAELVLSERTVDRHVSNIFTKLGLSSRAAATAYAYEHRLV
jgi:DNA-binding CsgD family transcriptional regulator/tetratricopeptide (TPR) repeat protein